jgi:hypothetical protein
MADIFISYSRQDETRIRNLVSALEGYGWSVFWDRRIPAGETWRSYIGSALQNARCIIVAWSEHSIESQWVAEEADEGKSRGVLVPVLLDHVQPPRGFREIQAADISDWQTGHPSQRLNALIADLERRLGKRSELSRGGQHREQRAAAAGEHESSVGSQSILRRRAFAVPLTLLLAVGAIGYFAINAMYSDKQTMVPAPIQEQTERQPDRTSAMGDWLVVAGSFGRADASAAEQRRIALTGAGHAATVIDTNEYPLLAPNLWAIIVGPFKSREMANAALARVKAIVPDAYVKKGR